MGAESKEAAEMMPSILSDTAAKAFVAGHRGLVGSVIHRKLVALGFTSLLLCTHAELDLTLFPVFSFSANFTASS